MLFTNFKIKYDDSEFYVLITEGDLEDMIPKTDRFGNLSPFISNKYSYISRLWIHNNILQKNQTLLNYVDGQIMSESEIRFLINQKIIY